MWEEGKIYQIKNLASFNNGGALCSDFFKEYLQTPFEALKVSDNTDVTFKGAVLKLRNINSGKILTKEMVYAEFGWWCILSETESNIFEEVDTSSKLKEPRRTIPEDNIEDLFIAIDAKLKILENLYLTTNLANYNINLPKINAANQAINRLREARMWYREELK